MYNIFTIINNKYLPTAFSGRPPTKIVLHPGGRSLVVGGGAFGLGGKRVNVLKWIISLGIKEGSGGRIVPSGPIIVPSGVIMPGGIIPY